MTLLGDGPSDDEAGPAADASAPVAGTDATVERVDIDLHSAVPIAIAFAVLAVTIWFVRSIPRTLALTAIATLIAVALNPVVEALRRRTGWQRKYAAALVLAVTGAIAITTLALVTVPTINQIRTFNKEIPKTVDQLGSLPIIGPRLREANASAEGAELARQRAETARRELEADRERGRRDRRRRGRDRSSALLLAITLLLDGERLVRARPALVPPGRRADADRFGRLVYNVVGRYIAGTLFIAAARRSRDAHRRRSRSVFRSRR